MYISVPPVGYFVEHILPKFVFEFLQKKYFWKATSKWTTREWKFVS